MARAIIVALAIASVAGPSLAQVNTTCRSLGGGVVNCSSTTPPPQPQYQQYTPPAGGGLAGIAAAVIANRRAAAQQAQSDQRMVLEARVLMHVRSHDCDRAVQAAIDGGDMNLAAQAKAVCQPATAALPQ